MSAEQQAAYSQLVEQLWTCSDNEQALEALMEANLERFDEGLLQFIQQEIANCKKQGNEARATFLYVLGEGILELKGRALGYHTITQELLNCSGADIQAYVERLHQNFVDVGLLVFLEQKSEYYQQTKEFALAEQYQQLIQLIQPPYVAARAFLGELLQCIIRKPDAINRFLEERLPQLNEHLLAVMPRVTANLLNQADIDGEALAGVFTALGNRLEALPLGERQLNLELAISSYQQALQVFTQEVMPVKWAITMMLLATAYRERIRGDKAENIERAIEALRKALKVRTREAMPVKWAITMGNLANAYSERIRGDKAENLELAIEAYQQVLQVLTREAMPVEWAITMMFLSNTYRKRIRGDKAKNLELAIEVLQQALQVRTRKAMPVDWA
ncbi:MAG: tetratricopeptide repeat protein, partial [Cyanobacteria bacterium P01_H01_bin.152]